MFEFDLCQVFFSNCIFLVKVVQDERILTNSLLKALLHHHRVLERNLFLFSSEAQNNTR